MNRRQHLNTLIAGLGLIASFSSRAAAQVDPPEPKPEVKVTTDIDLPSPESLFEKHIEAIGGKEKMKAIKSRRIEGRFVGRPFKFAARLTMWQEYPNKFHLKLHEPAGETIEICFDGETGWERQPGLGLREIKGLRIIELRDTADFWGEANWEDRYLEMNTLAFIENFNGLTGYGVHVKALSGREKLLIFSSDTGLYVGTRTLTVHPDTGKPAEFETVLAPYKAFAGVKLPMGMIQRFYQEKATTEITYHKVEINPEEKHDFSPPAELQKIIDAEKAAEDAEDSPEGES